MQTTKSSKYVFHLGGKLFEIELWATSYTIHELNLFEQLTRKRKKISVNKSRIAAYFRTKTNMHKHKFHPVFRIQNIKYRIWSQKGDHSISSCVTLTLCLWNADNSISSPQGCENTFGQDTYPSEPIVMKVDRYQRELGAQEKVSVLKRW